MKKIGCFLLAALLLTAWTGVSLADVTASYYGGQLTVSTDEQGFWEIFVDGEWTGYWVGSKMPTCTVLTALEEGEHTISIFNSDENKTRTVTILASESQPAATPEPQGPIKLEAAAYSKGVLTLRVSGLRGWAEVWLDGKSIGTNVTENGETKLLQLLPAGEHALTLYLPVYDEMDVKSFSAESFRPDAEALRPTLENLVKNASGERIASGLAIDRDKAGFLLRVSVDGKPGAMLSIGQDQLQALLDQGLNVIEYAAGKAVLRIELTQISDKWFDAPADVCSFALAAQENGVQVTVTAETENGAVEAAALTGVTLIRNGERIAVQSSGVY